MLVTGATSGLLSNSEVGITYSQHTNKITLFVTNKYLSKPSYGNKVCPWTNLLDHNSSHASIDDAVCMLKQVCKTATSEEVALLLH